MMDLTDKSGNRPTMALAHWIASLRYADLPERTKEVVRLALFDTVGCGVYGYETPWTQALLKWVRAGGAKGKRLHAGKAAHSGVLAAELAALGFTGPTQIFEFHDGGFLKAYSDASDPTPLTLAPARSERRAARVSLC